MKAVAFGIGLFLLIGFITIVSAFLFSIFFKVHLTNIVVDVDSINRYQELPTTVLGLNVFLEDMEPFEGGRGPDNPDTRDRRLIHCFNGNGPQGSHATNDDLCRKNLALYYNKFSNEDSGGVPIGGPVLTPERDEEVCSINIFADTDFCNSDRIDKLEYLHNQLKASLPINCYRYSFERGGIKEYLGDAIDVLRTDVGEGNCIESNPENAVAFKLNEIYPIPVFSKDGPLIASQRLFIGSVSAGNQEDFISWPKYVTDFTFKRGN